MGASASDGRNYIQRVREGGLMFLEWAAIRDREAGVNQDQTSGGRLLPV